MVTIFSDPTALGTSQKQLIDDRARGDIVAQIIHNRRFVYFQKVSSAYLDHFNPDFLFFHGDTGVQHHAVDMGMLYLWDLPFLLFGLYILLRHRNKLSLFLLIWLLIGPIPASITTGTPHPVRAIAMIPALQIIIAIGFISALYSVKRMNRKTITSLFLILLHYS